MELNYLPIDEYGYSKIAQKLETSSKHGCEFSRAAFLGWCDTLEYAEDGDDLYVRAFMDGEHFFFPPLAEDFVSAMRRLPREAVVKYAGKADVELLDEEAQGEFCWSSNRSEADYVYNAKDLIECGGKHLHTKRNHISKFTQNYNFTFEPYSDLDRADAIKLMSGWLETHDEPTEQCEEDAKRECCMLKNWLDNREKLKLFADVIKVDQKLCGLSIGEIAPNGVGVTMFEKADVAYEGIYSALTNMFSKAHYSAVEFVNRQEDMGIDGLRKAKLSWNPVEIVEKFTITKKPTIDEIRLKRMTEADFDAVKAFYDTEWEKLENKKFFLRYTDKELKEILGNGSDKSGVDGLEKSTNINADKLGSKCENNADNNVDDNVDSNGYFLGGYFGEKLLALCAVDFDKDYGDQLRADVLSDQNPVLTQHIVDINAEFGELEAKQFYEFSGVFVADGYRKIGLANKVCGSVREWAKQNLSPCVLCSLVQRGNEASAHNLKKLGFKFVCSKALDDYLFDYFVLLV